ncbi:hypothetical protein [Pseudonocardia parietis]|uniref:Uncharacterized protein n=1 Tax=Pseudonocardia parietis TaxID=570936 RepID=A0ABS4W3C2_9PSEU|nr:hypothetical protein [Pseudonocardia parietis]MBP2370682.1 hypothetical protein [Pseudonocardia parietis]
MTPTTPASDPAAVRGTPEWQAARFDNLAALATLAQTAVEVDGEQLDLFAAAPAAR